jgi:hypothetical protein
MQITLSSMYLTAENCNGDRYAHLLDMLSCYGRGLSKGFIVSETTYVFGRNTSINNTCKLKKKVDILLHFEELRRN